MFGFFGDHLYILMVLLPSLVLSLGATLYVKTTFSKYSRVRSARGLTGAEAASIMLERSGIHDVRIQRIPGSLTDHYDPRSKMLRLSEDVYDSSSLSAIGVACHEAGHALQHATNYAFLGLRTTLVPAASMGDKLSWLLMFLGFILKSPSLILFGIGLFSLAVLFTIVTLPVEWNASSRAKRAMVDLGVVLPQEQGGAACVLNAAFLTYLAAAITAVLTLVYYLIRAGVLGGRRDD